MIVVSFRESVSQREVANFAFGDDQSSLMRAVIGDAARRRLDLREAPFDVLVDGEAIVQEVGR